VPSDWFLHRLIFPRDMSVDVGREGRLYDDRVMRGNMSPIDHAALGGRDDEDQDDELIAVAIRRRKRLAEELAKLDNSAAGSIQYHDIWVPPPGTANTAPVNEDDPALTGGGKNGSNGSAQNRRQKKRRQTARH
jgi:hypothetical protein